MKQSTRRQSFIINAIAQSGGGIPKQSFILALLDNMVAWDKDTGEVRTIQYARPQIINIIVYDELGECLNVRND